MSYRFTGSLRWAVIVLGLFWGASVFAGASEWRSPEHVPGAVSVSVEQARALFDSGAAFIDVRSARQFDKRHIQGAHHLDLNKGLDEASLVGVVAKDKPLVVYCNGKKCSRSYRACEQAVDWGFSRVHYFRGGIADWRRAGFPVESAKDG